MKDLVKIIEENNFESMAIPALGCDLGGLDWEEVKLLLENYLNGLERTEITI